MDSGCLSGLERGAKCRLEKTCGHYLANYNRVFAMHSKKHFPIYDDYMLDKTNHSHGTEKMQHQI